MTPWKQALSYFDCATETGQVERLGIPAPQFCFFLPRTSADYHENTKVPW